MERKKELNIWLLVLSLITIITILLPFAKTLNISEDLSLWLKIVFYGTISIFIACLAVIAIIALLCLIKDQYKPIKFIEFCVLLGFFMVFTNIVVFACCGCKLSPGYAVMALEAFIMSAFSQSGRLFASFSGFGKDLLSLFKKEKIVEKKEEKVEEIPQEKEEESEPIVEVTEPAEEKKEIPAEQTEKPKKKVQKNKK